MGGSRAKAAALVAAGVALILLGTVSWLFGPGIIVTNSIQLDHVATQPDSTIAVDPANPSLMFQSESVGGLGLGLYSLDGGKTWQSAPSVAGQFSTGGMLGMLGDGSVIEAFPNAKHQSQLFAWKVGDAAWHPLAGAFQGDAQYLVVSPSGDGHETLLLVAKAADTFLVQRLTL